MNGWDSKFEKEDGLYFFSVIGEFFFVCWCIRGVKEGWREREIRCINYAVGLS